MRYYRSKWVRAAVVVAVLLATATVVVNAQRPDEAGSMQIYLEKIYYVVQQIRTSVGDALAELAWIRGTVDDIGMNVDALATGVSGMQQDNLVLYRQEYEAPLDYLLDGPKYDILFTCDQQYEIAAIYAFVDYYQVFDRLKLNFIDDDFSSYRLIDLSPEENLRQVEVLSLAHISTRPAALANGKFQFSFKLSDPSCYYCDGTEVFRVILLYYAPPDTQFEWVSVISHDREQW